MSAASNLAFFLPLVFGDLLLLLVFRFIDESVAGGLITGTSFVELFAFSPGLCLLAKGGGTVRVFDVSSASVLSANLLNAFISIQDKQLNRH